MAKTPHYEKTLHHLQVELVKLQNHVIAKGNKILVILEGRDTVGGTWDLFRYPGVRSDSDMFTLGYSFKPWTEPKAIADGSRILNYVRETAAENGIDGKIRFRHRVKRASWSSQWRERGSGTE